VRRDERQCARGSGSVVVGEPECELDERRRHAVDDGTCVRDVHPGGSPDARLDDDAPNMAGTERDRDDVALVDLVGDGVRERPRERPCGHERVDGRERHGRRA
jgi:hypothetical protein